MAENSPDKVNVIAKVARRRGIATDKHRCTQMVGFCMAFDGL
jgi:NADPH-dependent 7-cyano-7-deazaguanine reductase QueF